MKALSIQNLCKVYRNEVEALKNINLEVNEGDFFALLGPNGAGKSTLIGILTNLINKTQGSVSVFGHDIHKNSAAAKACMGVVPQEFNFSIFNRVWDVLIDQAGYYGISRRKAAVQAEYYLTLLGLWEKRYQKVYHLSGGMKRRLMIARALVHQPRLLILDEPTTGVDIELRRSTWEFLKSVNEAGTTIILTTHYLEEAEYLCRNIAIINKGEVIENTTMKSLLAKLDRERFILYLKTPCVEVPTLALYKIDWVDSQTLEVELSKENTMTQLLTELAAYQIEVLSLKSKTGRLEELFLSLTGNIK